MCMPVPQLMMMSTIAGATTSIMAGNAQARATAESAKWNIKQIQNQKQMAELEAQQAELSRMETFAEATSSNVAMFAMMGRSATDPSALALMARNEEAVQSDIERIKLQKTAIQNKMDLQMQSISETATEKATTAKRLGYFKALNTGAEGIINIKEIE